VGCWVSSVVEGTLLTQWANHRIIIIASLQTHKDEASRVHGVGTKAFGNHGNPE